MSALQVCPTTPPHPIGCQPTALKILPHHSSSQILRWRKLVFHTTSGGNSLLVPPYIHLWLPYMYICMYIPTHFLTNRRNWSGLLTSEHVLLPAMNLQSWSRLAWFFLRDAWAILPERSNTPGCQYRIFVLEIKRSNLMRSKIRCEGRLMLGVEACTISNKGKGKSSTKTSSFENTTSMDNLPATRKNQLISILWDNHADNHII